MVIKTIFKLSFNILIVYHHYYDENQKSLTYVNAHEGVDMVY